MCNGQITKNKSICIYEYWYVFISLKILDSIFAMQYINNASRKWFTLISKIEYLFFAALAITLDWIKFSQLIQRARVEREFCVFMVESVASPFLRGLNAVLGVKFWFMVSGLNSSVSWFLSFFWCLDGSSVLKSWTVGQCERDVIPRFGWLFVPRLLLCLFWDRSDQSSNSNLAFSL